MSISPRIFWLRPAASSSAHNGNSTQAVSASVRYLQQVYRKRVETTFSHIERTLPKSIHAVTARGFDLKVFLCVLAFSISGLVQLGLAVLSKEISQLRSK
jgi:hypothetical protein